MRDFIHLPKSDLHVHLSGVLTIRDINFINRKLNIQNHHSLNYLRRHFNFFDPVTWKVIRNIMIKPEGVAEALKIAVNKFAKDGVIKSEIIINTGAILQKLLDIEKVTELLSEILCEPSVKRKVDCKIRLGVNRRNGPKALLHISKIFQHFKNSGIFCGLDLNGDEQKYPTSEFVSTLEKIKKMCIPFTIHAGENPDLISSLQQAIKLEPQRIGHGLAAFKKESLVKELRQKKIFLEICPTSNIKTGNVTSFKTHPVFKLLEMNAPLVIATDNPGLFRTSLSKEYLNLYNHGVTIETLAKIANLSLTV